MKQQSVLDECPACGEDFGGTKAFERHRFGKHDYLYDINHPAGRRCLAPEEMSQIGMYVNAKDRWSQAPNGFPERLGSS